MNIRVLIADFIYCKGNLQEYINRRFQSKTQIVVDKDVYKYIVRHDGLKFYVKSDFFTLRDIPSDYNTSDLEQYDVAIDLGANIGGFSVIASPRVKRILALEPIRYKELQDNLDLNWITNVEVLPVGIGDGTPFETGWDGIIQKVPTITFEKVMEMVGPDKKVYLKCDTEGGEKHIPIELLKQVDAIEMELHHWEPEAAMRITEGLKETHDVTRTNVGAFGSIGVLHARKKK